jgi:hypothetical protein
MRPDRLSTAPLWQRVKKRGLILAFGDVAAVIWRKLIQSYVVSQSFSLAHHEDQCVIYFSFRCCAY